MCFPLSSMRSRLLHSISLIGFILLYVLLSNARRVNTEVIGSLPLSASILIPVLAGMFFGYRHGALVGFFGSLITVMSPAGSFLLSFAIIPMTLTGLVAGLFHNQFRNSFITSLSIPIGYLLVVASLIGAGFMSAEVFFYADFWKVLLQNSLFAAVAAIVAYRLLKLIEQPVVESEKRSRKTVSLQVGVWKILAVIFVVLTALFVAFFSFPLISITLVIGGALLMLADKLRVDFVEWADEKNLSGMKRKIYGHGLWLFWAVITIAIISVTITNITGAITDLGRTEAGEYVQQVEPYLPAFVLDNILTESNIRLAERAIFDTLAQVLTNSTAFMLIAIIVIPLMFITYFRQRTEIAESFSQMIPEKVRPDVMEMVSRVAKHLKAFVSVKIIESLIIAIICVIGFYIAGIEGFLILALIAGLLNVIPYIGPFLGAIPALLLSLTQSPTATLIVLITVLIAQLVDNLYLQPFMIAQQVQINPLLSVLITFIGAQALGIIGMLFAIPVYLVYKLILSESHRILVAYTK